MSVWDPLRNRSTPDVVVMLLAVVVGLVIVGSAVVVCVVAITDSDAVNTAQLADQVGQLTGALITLILGYVTGRGASAGAEPEKTRDNGNEPERG